MFSEAPPKNDLPNFSNVATPVMSVPTPLFTVIIAVSVFFLAAWELMVLNDRLNASPPGLTLRGWLLLIYSLHIACIALSAVCLGLRVKLSEVTLGTPETLRRNQQVLSVATTWAVSTFAASILLSGLLIVALAELTPAAPADLIDDTIDSDPSPAIQSKFTPDARPL